jgi:hypothetical protein
VVGILHGYEQAGDPRGRGFRQEHRRSAQLVTADRSILVGPSNAAVSAAKSVHAAGDTIDRGTTVTLDPQISDALEGRYVKVSATEEPTVRGRRVVQ